MTTTVFIYDRQPDAQDPSKITETLHDTVELKFELGEGDEPTASAYGATYRDSFVHNEQLFFFAAGNYAKHGDCRVKLPPGYQPDEKDPAYEMLVDGVPHVNGMKAHDGRVAIWNKCEEKKGIYNDKEVVEVVTARRRYEVHWQPRVNGNKEHA